MTWRDKLYHRKSCLTRKYEAGRKGVHRSPLTEWRFWERAGVMGENAVGRKTDGMDETDTGRKKLRNKNFPQSSISPRSTVNGSPLFGQR